MAPLVFLVIVLLTGVILFGVVSNTPRRGHGRRHPGRPAGASNRSVGPRLDRSQFAARWAVIQTMAAGSGNDLREAVSEADKLLDQALKQSGLSGDTMGDRLKSARARFSDRSINDGAWRAHKLRNALVHEVGFDLIPSQAREAIRDFERALRDLGVL
jgi:hypothetical protein